MTAQQRRARTIFDGPPYAAAPAPSKPSPSEPEPEPPPASDPETPAPTRIAGFRWLVATVLGTLCTLAALVLVVSALGVVRQVDRGNALVGLVEDAAERLDFGVFDADDGVTSFGGERGDLKNALLNRGVAALVWLLAGWVLAGAQGPFRGATDRDSVTVR